MQKQKKTSINSLSYGIESSNFKWKIQKQSMQIG